jgi:hypothetical protein
MKRYIKLTSVFKKIELFPYYIKLTLKKLAPKIIMTYSLDILTQLCKELKNESLSIYNGADERALMNCYYILSTTLNIF